MEFDDALDIAERQLIDGATLQELKEAAQDLRALSRESALADLVEQKIASIETRRTNSCMPPSSSF
ncbi:hypothetical protein [Microvirga puerhi]|uniref:Uncharacterized protein n=1 Tax=Microvirga puerhi TaxID=2876078 RepID=A0ABS7VSN5_9HYPH|nr:hypothetical protein [Microvirga puerhi]MBZ6078090.1 hypothetical protein [Microvirga puerhi]